MIGTDTRGRGFSIVEVLTVVGIFSVLVLLARPVWGGLVARADNAKCVSNLRQIGAGMLAYAHDNQGRLPGPLYSGQFAYWTSSTQLAWHLLDYLNVDDTRTKARYSDIFHCPAYEKAVVEFWRTAVYTVNIRVPFRDQEEKGQPFGYPNSKYPSLFGTKIDYAPMRLVKLADIVDAEGRPAQSQTWAMKDADQEALTFYGGESVSYQSSLPQNMVHGRHRNALFFDFHVGPVDFSNTPLP